MGPQSPAIPELEHPQSSRARKRSRLRTQEATTEHPRQPQQRHPVQPSELNWTTLQRWRKLVLVRLVCGDAPRIATRPFVPQRPEAPV